MFWNNGNHASDPKVPAAVERYEQMLKNGSFTFLDAFEWEDVIQYYMGCNNARMALDATRRAVDQYPYSTNFLLTKAQLLAANGRMRLALRILSKVESIDPSTAELFIIKGAIYSKLDEKGLARENFNKAIFHSDQLDMTYFDIAMECESLGNFTEAIRFLKKSYDANPTNPNILSELAFCYDVTDQVDESIRFHQALIDNNPYQELAWFNLAVAQCKKEDYEGAYHSFEYASLIRDNFWEAHFEMGEMLVALNKRKEAISAYEQSLMYFKSPRTLYCIGECWEELEDYSKAARYYKRALRGDPAMADAWFGLGITSFQNRKETEAIQQMRKAIRLDEFNGEYWYMLGEVLKKTGDHEGAEEAYRTVIKLEPFTASAWVDLAELLIAQDRVDEGILTAIEGSKEHPDFSEIFYRISGYMLLHSQRKEGLRYLEDALALDYPGHQQFLQAFPALKNDPHISYLIELYHPHS
ncbi:MAG: tetratricopeptide repeat protein [Flavobacteriales bacterium]|nr:tetratricopeptide repeat protein [Flavobacteriales bacterium]MCB9448233.1 tetratricopeptide repeat protein [Flavobacteriales bacterium]